MYNEPIEIGTRRIVVDCGDQFGTAYLIPRCHCGRFVKADDKFFVNGFGKLKEPNGTCKEHGRIAMPFEGWF